VHFTFLMKHQHAKLLHAISKTRFCVPSVCAVVEVAELTFSLLRSWINGQLGRSRIIAAGRVQVEDGWIQCTRTCVVEPPPSELLTNFTTSHCCAANQLTRTTQLSIEFDNLVAIFFKHLFRCFIKNVSVEANYGIIMHP
jgi:fucose 4-O-acetylase-like acetyltransferase